MEYITASSGLCYNSVYFNVLESMEYELMLYEHMSITEAYTDILEEDMAGAEVDSKKPGLVRRAFNKLKSKNSAMTKGEAFKQKIQQYFKIIKAKLKEIIQKFVDKVDELFKLNQKFIDERIHYIAGIKDKKFWDSITVSIYNYNESFINGTIYTIFNCPKVDSKGMDIKKLISEKSTKEDFIKNHFRKVLQHAGPKDGFKEAAKNFFRNTQTSEDKMPQLKGGAAEDRCIKCAAYLKAYKNSTAKRIRDALTELNGSWERVEKDFEENKLAEYMESYIPIMEAENDPPNGSVQVDNKVGNQTVDQKDKNHTGTEAFTKLRDYNDVLFTLHTAQMTIAEEYYFASLHVLKSVYSNAEKQGKLDLPKAETERKRLINQNDAIKDAKKYNNAENVVNAAKNNR